MTTSFTCARALGLATALLALGCGADPSAEFDQEPAEATPEALRSGLHGWAYADQPTSASYTPSQRYNSKSTGVTAKKTATGTYQVLFKNLGVPNTPLHLGNTQVVAVGTDSVHCKASTTVSDGAAINPSIVAGVVCHNSSGNRADSKFVVMYASVDASPAGDGAYGWFGSSCQTGEMPNWNSAGSYMTCTRHQAGVYTVAVGGLGLIHEEQRGNVQVTAQGSGSDRCKSSVTHRGSELWINVRCYAKSGALADESFYFNYSSGHATSPAGLGAYATAHRPQLDVEYEPFPAHSHASGAIRAGLFNGSTGRHWLRFPGLGGGRRVPFVAAVDDFVKPGVYCKLERWQDLSGTLEIQTRCYDADYQLIDTYYSAHVPYQISF